MTVKRRLWGIRAKIPQGVMLARKSGGDGDVELVTFDEVKASDMLDIADALKNVVEDLTPQAGGFFEMNGFMMKWAAGADIASAAALPLLTDGNSFNVTGTTTITSIDTVGVGTVIILQFAGVLILEYDATDLILPTGSDITTAAGDIAMFREYATGDWECINYMRADGSPLTGGGLNDVVDDLTPQAGGVFSMNNFMFKEADDDFISSAATLNLTDGSNTFFVTGTTTITKIEDVGRGTKITLHFQGVLTLTHSVDLLLPNDGNNIVTAAGDYAEFFEYATADWVCINYQRANGTSLRLGLGIVDNATGERLNLTDTDIILGTSGAQYIIRRSVDDQSMILSGGNSSGVGANIKFWGSSHSSKANDIVFRSDVTQILLWDDSAGTWSFLSTGVIIGGSLIVATQTPASASATGTAGTMTWDDDFIYICTATDTWKRVAIATW